VIDAIIAFLASLFTIALKWGTATAEERKKLEAEAEESWQRCKAAVFKLHDDVEKNNAAADKAVDDKFGPETMSAPALDKTGLLSDDGSDAS
jgi:hypothetical protein